MDKDNYFIPFLNARCCINCGNIFDISRSRFYKPEKLQFCNKRCFNQFTIIPRPEQDKVKVLISKEDMEQFPERNRVISKKLRFLILRRDSFKCVYCGRSPRKDKVTLHIDHIYPWSKGGNTTSDNLATSCKDCNSGKSSSEFDEATNNKLREEIYEKINQY